MCFSASLRCKAQVLVNYCKMTNWVQIKELMHYVSRLEVNEPDYPIYSRSTAVSPPAQGNRSQAAPMIHEAYITANGVNKGSIKWWPLESIQVLATL